MAAILVVTMGGAAEEPATPQRRSHRREQLRALSSRAAAYLVPAGGPATAPLRGPHSRGDVAVLDEGSSTDAQDGGAEPLVGRDDVAEEAAPVPAAITPDRGAPAGDLPAEEHHPRVEGAAPTLAVASGGPALGGPITTSAPAPDPEAGAQVGTDPTTGPVLVAAPEPATDPAPTAPVPTVVGGPATLALATGAPAAGEASERADEGADLPWSTADRRPRSSREPLVPASRVRRALRRLRGTLVLIVLLVGLGTVLALILVGIAALAALGIRAALSA